MYRRLLITSAPTLLLAPKLSAQKPNRPDKGPALPLDLVKEFVGAGHGNLLRVKEMLAATPGLVKSAWDWGGGDFETALGGAGHMGQREIAEFLIAQGAPIELHAAAMLGKLSLVKAAVAEFPNAAAIPGPHNITLLAHARKGGAQAEAVVRFLESI